MITKYQDFLTENNEFTEKDPEYYGITNYEWDNGKLNVNQDVIIHNLDVTKLPFPFGIVNGDFFCKNNKLTTLKNSPTKVMGNFDCSYNNISSLLSSPEYIKGDFVFSHNPKIISFEYCPKEVGYMNYPIILADDETYGQRIENYPLCIIHTEDNFKYSEFTIKGVRIFNAICHIVYQNMDKFRPVLDNVKEFHLMVIHTRQVIIPYYVSFINELSIEDFPMLIPEKRNLFEMAKTEFNIICTLIYDNTEKFRPILNNKIAFHQMLMRLNPDLIPYYKTITPPTKKSILFNI